MAVKKIEIETPDGKKKSININFDKEPSESELNAAVEHYMSNLGQKELQQPKIQQYEGQRQMEEYFQNLENQPPRSFGDKLGDAITDIGKRLVSPITAIPSIPEAIKNFYSQGPQPHLPGEYGGEDPLNAFNYMGAGAAGGAISKLTPPNVVGAGRALGRSFGAATDPRVWAPAGAGAWIGGHIAQGLGQPFGEGASVGAAIGGARSIPAIYRAGRAGFESAADLPPNWGEFLNPAGRFTSFPRPQISDYSGPPMSQGAAVMPPATSAPAPLPHPVQATETAPPMIWGPSAALNASTEGAFQFPQRQIPAVGATPPPTPIQMPGQISFAPRSGVGPVQGQVPLPFNLLDKLREVRSLAETKFPDAAGPIQDRAAPTAKLKPVKAPSKSTKPQKAPVQTPETKIESVPEKTSETIPESKTTETASKGEGGQEATTPESEKGVLTMSFVEGEARNLGIPYSEVLQHLKNEGYKIISDFDTQKYGLFRRGP